MTRVSPRRTARAGLRHQHEARELAARRVQRAAGDQLADDAAPERGRPVPPDAEGRQLVVPVLGDHRRRLAAQHADDVQRAEHLAGAVDRGEHLLRRHRAVERPHRRAADCRNGRTARGQLLAEAGEQRAGAALGGLGQADHRLQPRPHHVPLRLRRARTARGSSAPGRCPRRHRAAACPPARRRGRRGRSAGNRLPGCPACRDARRSARPAGRSPCRTRWSPR